MILAKRFLSASMVLSLALVLGRLAGFVREIQLGALLGVSRDADFAIVMLTTPDLLVNLLLAGGLSAALIPEFSRLDRAGRTKLFVIASLSISALFGLIALVVVVYPAILMLLFAPGYAGVPMSEYSRDFGIAALAIPLAGLAGVSAALLNAEEKFFVAGSGTLIFNLTIVTAMALYWSSGQALLVLAAAIALASLLRYGSQLAASAFYLSRQPSLSAPTQMRDLVRRFVQALGASTLVLLVPVILRAVVSVNGAGNIAAYNFATKLVELPLGIAITTISVVAFPAISKALVAGDEIAVQKIFEDGVRRSMAIALSIAIPCIWFAHDLVRVVFGHGQMDEAALRLVGDLAQLGFLTLPLVAVSSMATALLTARHQTGRLLRITMFCMILVPIVAMPGIVTGNPRLSIAALPAFYLFLAIALARATRQRLFSGSTWLTVGALRPLAVAGIVTLAFAVLQVLSPSGPALVAPSIALTAIAVSVLAVGALTGRARLG